MFAQWIKREVGASLVCSIGNSDAAPATVSESGQDHSATVLFAREGGLAKQQQLLTRKPGDRPEIDFFCIAEGDAAG